MSGCTRVAHTSKLLGSPLNDKLDAKCGHGAWKALAGYDIAPQPVRPCRSMLHHPVAQLNFQSAFRFGALWQECLGSASRHRSPDEPATSARPPDARESS